MFYRIVSCVGLIMASMWLAYDLIHHNGMFQIGLDLFWMAGNVLYLAIAD